MPTPRLINSMNHVPTPVGAPDSGDTTGQITTEVIEGPAPGAQYFVRGGMPVRTRSPLSLQEGDVVSVKWQNGKPFVILNVQSRKGPGHDVIFSGPLVEVLYIATDDHGTKDIWFRNSTTLADLKLRGDWGGPDPDEVKWGARPDSFFVRIGSNYFTYKFPRTGGLDSPITKPKPKLLKTEQPWTNETLLTTVEYAATISIETPCVYSLDTNVQQHGPPFDVTYVSTSTIKSTVTRGDSNTQTTPVKLTQVAVSGNSIIVFDAELDYQYNLIVMIQAKMGLLVNRPAGTVPDIEFKTYGRIEQPVGTIISEDGDPTAQDEQCVLEPSDDSPDAVDDPIGWQAPAADDDWHAMIVNVTKGLVIWKSALDTTAIASDVLTVNGVGSSATIRSQVSLFPTADDRLLVNAGHRDVPGLLPNNVSPPVDPHPQFDSITLDTHSNGDKIVLDPAAISFLQIPAPLDRGTFTSSATKFAHNPYGRRGTALNDPTLLDNVYLESVTNDTHDARKSQILLYPVRYLPHRTKAGGQVFLFAIAIFFTDGTPTSQQFSFWWYETDTKRAVRIQDWTVESLGTNAFAVDIIGASLKHVLWILRRGDVSQRWEVKLSDLKGSTKILFDETAADFATIPPDVDAFLKRNWEVVRPDFLYLLDDADKKVTNEFLVGWNAQGVTLDPAKLSILAKMKPFAKLKSPLAHMTPVAAPSGNPPKFRPITLHILNPHSSPGFIQDV